MSGVKTGVCGSGVKSNARGRSKRRPGLHTCSAATAPDEVLDDDGSPQKEAVPTPYRSEGSNPGPLRLIKPKGRPSQRLVTCHGREKAKKPLRREQKSLG